MRLSSPSVARNRDVILDHLARVLPATGRVLELASGSGEHAVHCAAALPGLTWQPTDPDPGARASVAAWTAESGLTNVRPPLDLDAQSTSWPAGPYDAVVAINLVHISPWATTRSLLEGAARVLVPGGVLFLYGAYRRGGQHTAPSNEQFDAWLKSKDPAFGVRDLERVVAEAEAAGLRHESTAEVPANNLVVVFRR